MAKNEQIVTSAWFDRQLAEDQPIAKRKVVVGRAILAIFKNQTIEEQSIATTIENNGIGFTGCDAKLGTLTVKLIKRYNDLPDNLYKAWTKPTGKKNRPRVYRYIKQLNAIANNLKATKDGTVHKNSA